MAMLALLNIVHYNDAFSSFGNQAVFFLIGAFILATAIEKYGLHKRIAFNFLKFFEDKPRLFTFGIMLCCALLSFIVPEHAVVALFLPIAISILTAMKIVPGESNFGKICILSIAYGCSIGSLGTLIGGARNPLTIGVLENQGVTITFVEWMKYSMPVVFIALPAIWLLLQAFFPLEQVDLTKAKQEINRQVEKLGGIRNEEKITLIIVLFTMALWIFASQTIGLAIVAIVGAILLFLTGLVTWKDVEQHVPWGIVLLYGGAITLGIGMEETGAAHWIASLVLKSLGDNPYLIILGLIILAIYTTNLMSNTGAVAMLLPIGIGFANEIPGVSTLMAAMLIALSSGLAFMFVIATPGNALTYSSGYYSTWDLFRVGSIANLVCIVILWAIATLYWKGVLGI
jgi:sodium-dependent dicarboxylate transporter 2/3/5